MSNRNKPREDVINRAARLLSRIAANEADSDYALEFKLNMNAGELSHVIRDLITYLQLCVSDHGTEYSKANLKKLAKSVDELDSLMIQFVGLVPPPMPKSKIDWRSIESAPVQSQSKSQQINGVSIE